MLLNQFVEFSQFRAAKAMRFCSLTAKEEKTVSVDTKHFWQGGIVSVESIKARVLREHKAPNV
jgi:hypothetical protein